MASCLALVFGILGNIMSFLVYLAPLPTFHRIYKRKSTEGFQSIPYSVALFTAMIYLYYAYLKQHSVLLLTINSIGTAIQSLYLTTYMIYGTKRARIFTITLLLVFNFGALGVIVLMTYLFAAGDKRVSIVGWICAGFSVCVFASPLSIIRKVIKTKSVEFMPFYLSFFLTLCAVVWLLYGLLIHDYYVAMPNVLGFAFGIAQMILYAIYSDRKTQASPVTADGRIQDITIVVDMRAVEMLEKSGMMESGNEDDVIVAVKDDGRNGKANDEANNDHELNM